MKNLEDLKTKCEDQLMSDKGFYPHRRPHDEYMKYGVIILDKPQNPSSHEISTWVKNILGLEKTGHSGTLDPQVSGVLTVCLERATRLVKCQQHAGKQYVCVIEFSEQVDEKKFRAALQFFRGKLLQRPPLMSAVKRSLRLREIYKIEFVECRGNLGLFKVDCEAGTYIRTLCEHIGLKIGNSATMKELRRTRSGNTDEAQCVTMHDVRDAMYLYEKHKDEAVLRKVVQPLESLLTEYKRIIIKDSSVESICHGAKLTVPGVLKYDRNLEVGTEAILVTTKGEAVALVTMTKSSSQIEMTERGIICDIKRVIMEKGIYDKQWKKSEEMDLISVDN